MKLKIFSTTVVLLTLTSLYGTHEVFAIQYPDEGCTDCIVNEKNQILTIFNFESEEYPFLANKATFLITPNPFMHNLDADSIDPQKFGINLIITDNDSLDSDPMIGVIELVGVNPGMYGIFELKGPAGLLKTDEMFSSDEIFDETYSHVHVTNFFIDPSSILTSINMDSPDFDETVLLNLQNYHATIGGVTLTLLDQIPSAKMANINELFSGNAPNHIRFGNIVDGLWDAPDRFSNLGIPSYQGPSSTTSNPDLAFIPPVFVTENDDNTNFVMSPIIEEINPGTNMLLRLDKTDTSTSSGSAITGINLPLNTYGKDIGISLQIYHEPPTNFQSFNPDIADSSIFLDFTSVGNIDFGNPETFSEPAKVYFVIPSVGVNCQDGVQVFRLNDSTNQWEPVNPSPERNPSGDTAQSCGYVQHLQSFSTYLVVTGSSDGTSGDTNTGGGGSRRDHGDHDHGDHDHSSHSHGDKSSKRAQDGLAGITEEDDESEFSTEGERTLEFGGILQDGRLEFGRSDARNTLKFGERLYDETAKFGTDVTIATLTELGRTAPDYGYEFGNTFSGTRLIVDVHEKTFPIKYNLNGQIKKVAVNQETKSISFSLENVLESDLTIRVPRTLVNADDNQFFVSVVSSPESLVDYSIVESSEEFVTLNFMVPDYAKQATILGTTVVPEFGLSALLVFVIATSSIVILFRSRLSIVN